MSTFCGRMKEYSEISIDRFDGGNLNSTVFFLSHCHRDHMIGLCRNAFAERLQSSTYIYLYMSDVSKVLLLGDNTYNFHHLEPYIRTIPVKRPSTITIPCNTVSDKPKLVSVTLLPAGHCPGSVMFLFEGNEGTVLYTGDFRYEKDKAVSLTELHNELGIKPIKSLYIDTTFCVPNALHFPSRFQCVEVTVQLVKNWLSLSKSHFVYIASPMNYGHEHLQVEIFKHTHQPIHTSDWKYSIYTLIQDIALAYTTDPTARIHACGLKKKRYSKSYLPCGHLFDTEDEVSKLLVVRPSTMWFTMSTIRSEKLVEEPSKSTDPHRVCYSLHSSYSEIKSFVSYLNPHEVFPNVIPYQEPNALMVQARLNSFLKPRDMLMCKDPANVSLGNLNVKFTVKRTRSPSLSGSEDLLFDSPEKRPKTISYLKHEAVKDGTNVGIYGDGLKATEDLSVHATEDESCEGNIEKGQCNKTVISPYADHVMLPKQSSSSSNNDPIKTPVGHSKCLSTSSLNSDHNKCLSSSPVNISHSKCPSSSPIDSKCPSSSPIDSKCPSSSPTGSKCHSSYQGSDASGSEMDLFSTPTKSPMNCSPVKNKINSYQTLLERDDEIIRSWEEEDEAYRLYISSDDSDEDDDLTVSRTFDQNILSENGKLQNDSVESCSTKKGHFVNPKISSDISSGNEPISIKSNASVSDLINVIKDSTVSDVGRRDCSVNGMKGNSVSDVITNACAVNVIRAHTSNDITADDFSVNGIKDDIVSDVAKRDCYVNVTCIINNTVNGIKDDIVSDVAKRDCYVNGTCIINNTVNGIKNDIISDDDVISDSDCNVPVSVSAVSEEPVDKNEETESVFSLWKKSMASIGEINEIPGEILIMSTDTETEADETRLVKHGRHSNLLTLSQQNKTSNLGNLNEENFANQSGKKRKNNSSTNTDIIIINEDSNQSNEVIMLFEEGFENQVENKASPISLKLKCNSTSKLSSDSDSDSEVTLPPSQNMVSSHSESDSDVEILYEDQKVNDFNEQSVSQDEFQLVLERSPYLKSNDDNFIDLTEESQIV